MTRSCTIVLLLTLIVGCNRAPAQPAAQTTAAAQKPGSAATSQPAAATQMPPAPGAPGAAPAEPPKPVPAQLPDVLARVNGEPIQKAEFERALKNILARAGQPIPAEKRDEVYRGLLDQLVAFHVLLQESKARNIQVTDAEIDGRVEDIKKQFPSEEEFKKALASRNTTIDDLKQEARQEMILSKLVEAEVKPQIKIEESDIKGFYDQNPERFQQAEAVRASHILIRTEQNASAQQKEEAKAKADDLLKQVKSGADFAELAKKNSQDGSAPQGGDLNFFSRGQMVPPFEQAAFSLKPGETSEVVETQFGYHIIKVTEHRAARTVPLTEVAPRIGQFLAMQQQQERTEAFINTLKAKSKIEILI